MQYGFPIAKKPEVARFDNTGVDGPHANFMQLISLYLIKGIIVYNVVFIGPVKGIANRFRPGTIDKLHSEIFSDLSFVDMERIDFTRDGSELHFLFHGYFVREDFDVTGLVVGKATDKHQSIGFAIDVIG